jgi:hypothetical protein
MHRLPKDQSRHDRVGSSKHTTGEMHWGQEVGPIAPPGLAEPLGAATPLRPAALAQLAQMSHQASITQGNTAVNDPDRRNKVGSIRRSRLASLGSMDLQTSEQQMWGNVQDFVYT